MKEQKKSLYADRRERIKKVSEILAEKADDSKFVSTYARMNPSASHKLNSFLFGNPTRIARAVIFGPWLYIHAPQVTLPKGTILVSEEESKKRHLGRLTAKIPLTENNSVQIVEKLLQAFEDASSTNSKS